MGLRIFLQDRIELAAKTEIGIVSDYFCTIAVGLRKFCTKRGEKRGEELDSEVFCPKSNGRKGVGLEIICPNKKGERE